MQAPDPVETVLARLMPSALSQGSQLELEEMFDELAGMQSADNTGEISSGRWLGRYLIGGGIAAAIGALIAIFPITGNSGSNGVLGKATDATDQDLVLVKRAQLEEAIRRSRPGEEIVISGISDGKPLEMRMKIGDGPNLQNPHPDGIVEPATLLEAPPRGTELINLAEKSASLTADDGIAVVWHMGNSYGVKISDFQSNTTFERQLSPNESSDELPMIWRDKIQVLRRSLDQALERGAGRQREPRPRIDPLTPAAH